MQALSILSFFYILSISLRTTSLYLRDFLFDNEKEHSLFDKFEQWIIDFKYNIDSSDHFYSAFGKWIDNNEYIEIINSKGLTYSLGHNQFSVMDRNDYHEFLSRTNMYINETHNIYNFTLESTSLPTQVNWVTNGAVTPVKDQGQCGSCWSFSTTGALEGVYYIKNKKLESFSEQQLIDCDNFKNGGRDHGCNGGLMDNAFTWINKNGGLCLESDYPYISGTTEKSGDCETSCSNIKGSDIKGYTHVPIASDDSMMSALLQQPVSIAIEADQRDFQLYKSGIFTGECGTNLDHGVLAVGYGIQEEGYYYLVKNSWGTSWGDYGYIKLGRGPEYNNGQGQCGILLEGSFPTV